MVSLESKISKLEDFFLNFSQNIFSKRNRYVETRKWPYEILKINKGLLREQNFLIWPRKLATRYVSYQTGIFAIYATFKCHVNEKFWSFWISTNQNFPRVFYEIFCFSWPVKHIIKPPNQPYNLGGFRRSPLTWA